MNSKFSIFGGKSIVQLHPLGSGLKGPPPSLTSVSSGVAVSCCRWRSGARRRLCRAGGAFGAEPGCAPSPPTPPGRQDSRVVPLKSLSPSACLPPPPPPVLTPQTIRVRVGPTLQNHLTPDVHGIVGGKLPGHSKQTGGVCVCPPPLPGDLLWTRCAG